MMEVKIATLILGLLILAWIGGGVMALIVFALDWEKVRSEAPFFVGGCLIGGGIFAIWSGIAAVLSGGGEEDS